MKWVAAIVGLLLLALIVAIGVLVGPVIIAFNKADITDMLVRDGRYDPAAHFAFDRACTSDAGDAGNFDLREQGYSRTNPVDNGEPTAFWPLTLIDDSNKTYRVLYGYDLRVEAPGLVCNSKITLRTETVDGHLRAYVEEAREHEKAL